MTLPLLASEIGGSACGRRAIPDEPREAVGGRSPALSKETIGREMQRFKLSKVLMGFREPKGLFLVPPIAKIVISADPRGKRGLPGASAGETATLGPLGFA
jgi:hypothetical protein